MEETRYCGTIPLFSDVCKELWPRKNESEIENVFSQVKSQEILGRPSVRPLRKYLDYGVIPFYKPLGITSHEQASKVKKILAPLSISKVGHGGTLDPNASGLLPMSLNNANLAQESILASLKEYQGTFHLHDFVDPQTLIDTFALFEGKIYQYPPDRSAIDRQLRIREIFSQKILNIQGKDVKFQVTCSAGTYMRTLCVHVGEILGCGAHLTQLERIRSGVFQLSKIPITEAVVEQAVQEWKSESKEQLLRQIVMPIEMVLYPLPKIVVFNKAIPFIQDAQPIKASDVCLIDPRIKKGETIGIFNMRGEIIAFGTSYKNATQMREAEGGHFLRIEKIF